MGETEAFCFQQDIVGEDEVEVTAAWPPTDFALTAELGFDGLGLIEQGFERCFQGAFLCTCGRALMCFHDDHLVEKIWLVSDAPGVGLEQGRRGDDGTDTLGNELAGGGQGGVAIAEISAQGDGDGHGWSFKAFGFWFGRHNIPLPLVVERPAPSTKRLNSYAIFPNFIAIEGNIGAGKTTLARRLAEDRNSRLILEAFSDNPFLPPFYAEPERYAFPVELFFMAERHKQLQAELAQTDLFSSGVIADYIFVKTLLFARNTLPTEEFRLFSRLFKVMDAGFPNPDLIVFLDRPVEALQANIAKRGRAYELKMKDDYLASVRAAYYNYFGTQKEVPVLVLELGELNFAEDEAVYDRMVTLMARPYPVGVTTVRV